jgi:hypothetical protein
MRRTTLALVAGLLAGGLLMAASPGLAGNGDPLVLGKKNHASRVTKLIGKNGIEIRSSKNIPLRLYSPFGVPPIQVNSHTKIDMLNADYVDGWSGVELRSDSNWCSNDDIASGVAYECTKPIQIPAGGGTVFMTGSISMYGHPTDQTGVVCSFWWDDGSTGDVQIPESWRAVTVEAGVWAQCSTQAVLELPKGTYDLKFAATNPSGAVDPAAALAWFIVLPN